MAHTQLESRIREAVKLDTVFFAAGVYPDLETYELSELCNQLDISHHDKLRHSSLGDSIITARLFIHLLKKSKVVALGEIGLDYFKNISDKKIQKNIFREQLELAQEINVPIVFHNRDSDKDILDTLSKFPDVIGVAHCFSSTYEVAKKLIDMGFYISFSGNLTFKNSHLPDVAKKLPLNKILVETDSPFLSPVPHRGKVNEPGRTRFVAELLAKLHGSTINQIASITTNNATNLFNL